MKISFFGGTGGLGKEVNKHLSKNNIVDCVGSDRCNLSNDDDIIDYFSKNDPDVVIFFSVYNNDSFIHKANFSEIDKQISINITGVTKSISLALNKMRYKGFGRIILASSVVVSNPVAGTSIYSSCKSYYENIIKTIAIENATKGITANCIQLGYMNGGLMNIIPEDIAKNIINSIPCKKLGSIDDINRTIDYIIESDYLNGETIKISGGL